MKALRCYLKAFELAVRGAQPQFFISTDNLTGFSSAIRNSTKYVSYKDIKKPKASLHQG